MDRKSTTVVRTLCLVAALALCVQYLPAQSTALFTVMGSIQSPSDIGSVTIQFTDTLGNSYGPISSAWDGNSTATSIATDLSAQFNALYSSLVTAGNTGPTFGVALKANPYATLSSFVLTPNTANGNDFYIVYDGFTAPQPAPPGTTTSIGSGSTQTITVTMNPDGGLTIGGSDPNSSDPESQLIAQEMTAVTPTTVDDTSGAGTYSYTVTYADGSTITVTESFPYEDDSTPLYPPAPSYDPYGGDGGGDSYSQPCC